MLLYMVHSFTLLLYNTNLYILCTVIWSHPYWSHYPCLILSMVYNIRNHCHIWLSPIAVSFRKVMLHTHSPMRHFISSKDFLYWALLVLCHPSDWWLCCSRTASALYSSIDGCGIKLRWHLTGQPHSSLVTEKEQGGPQILETITQWSSKWLQSSSVQEASKRVTKEPLSARLKARVR